MAGLVEAPTGGLVSLDGDRVRALMLAALRDEAISEFSGFEVERTDVPVGTSRFDFELSNVLGQSIYLDVVSVTGVDNRVALFPETRSHRGTRQLRSLARLSGRGRRSGAVLFLVPRIDADLVMAARKVDQDFADALSEAAASGVRILARRCQVTLNELILGVPLDVRIPPA